MGRAAKSGALTESVFYILLRLHRPAHGYALMKEISQMTNGRVNLGAGSLYGALDALQKKGWIKALDEHPTDRKVEYIITDTGKQFFEKELDRLEEMLTNASNMKEATDEDDR
ncbi:PadR family transcriptional regulator [Slackia heliotrinireducens]|uniref:Transcriptional regulator, PadR family n=1 Tax=Slackia heliotrinireducens (strain ATCC 29202 / DSM 20476 / NCTC 11029 / RHS 1) TaxID=471855 RepID=C7N786_SLAHD|nr:PadR family transcriptional regulator [Slackia heliotrinireducens]ACV22771.1 transcriptional regulator, PadR family [Slackia heliotrinireducens DSM 20476]VEH01446.1 transcriptional regulator, Acidobacterial, PadR-family [Slackia heliotrinireducens]